MRRGGSPNRALERRDAVGAFPRKRGPGGTAAAVATTATWFGPSQAGISLAAITAVVAFVAAVQTAAVAIVGEYVSRTYREVQGRPPWVIRRTIGPATESRTGSRAA